MSTKLSVLVPAIPGRLPRLKAMLSRLSLSAHLYNQKYPGDMLTKESLEFVVVDGGSSDATKDMCLAVGKAHRMKYIFLPIGKFINAAYPRNVGLRVCQGDVVGHLDVDHYPSENIVEGMLRPFVEGKINRNINRGYVVDTSKSPMGAGPNVLWLEKLNDFLLNQSNLRCKLSSVYEEAEIPPPGVNGTLWIWAAKRCYLEQLNGYDEQYCRSYVREDDDWRERLLASGLQFHDGAHEQFCAIHLWHPAAWRDLPNNWNKQYFQRVCNPVNEVRRNVGHEWGKMLDGSFSFIDGAYREPAEHEEWIAANRGSGSIAVPAYVGSKTWRDTGELVRSLR